MLKVTELSRLFQNGSTGFQSVDFSIQKGEIIGILGTSGCGKSTLLRVVAGLDTATEGTLAFEDGSDKIGMVYQEPRLFPWLRVSDNVNFGLKNAKPDTVLIEKWLAKVGLTGFDQHYPKDLSGGMAQRVAIARALITNPSLLLLDEPFSALDAFTKMQLQDLLITLWNQENTTMLLVTHDIDEALYVCDRLLVMYGQPGEIIEDYQVKRTAGRDRHDPILVEQKKYILSLLQGNKQLASF